MWPSSRQLPRLILALFCASAIALLWMFVSATTVAEWLSGQGRHEDVLVRADEFIVHSYQTGAQWTPYDTYRYPDGRPVPAVELKKWTAGSWPTPTTFVGPLKQFVDYANYAPHGWNYRLSLLPSTGLEPAHWYLIHDDSIEGHAYFAGYDQLTRALVGYLGKDGLVQIQPPEDRQFAIDLRRMGPGGGFTSGVAGGGHTDFRSQSYQAAHLPSLSVYLLSGDELWLADLRQGTARQLGAFPGAFDLHLAPLPPGAMDAPEKIEEHLMLRTRTEMIQLSLDGKESHHWTIPVEARDRMSFDWYNTGDGRAAVRYSLRFSPSDREDAILWLAADGSVVRREVVALRLAETQRVQAGLFAVMLPSPTMYTYMAHKFASMNLMGDPLNPGRFREVLALYLPFLLLVYGVSTALAICTHRRQTRYALPAAGLWAVFVFLLGVPGWLAYRWHRDWPLLKECGDCHRAAPRDREACAACGQLFAAPPPLGTEIFG